MICKTYELNTLKSYKYKEITPMLFKKNRILYRSRKR